MRPPESRLAIPFLRRRALASIAVVVVIFASVGMLSASMLGAPVTRAMMTATILGVGVGIFEELFVQSRWGRSLRRMHPLASALIYTGIVCVLLVLASLLSHVLFGELADMPQDFHRLLFAAPIAIAASMLGILAMRVIGFLGADTLVYLLVGKYYRPAFERKIFLFLDMKDSTATAERLGALKAMDLIRKFLFDLSKPITDNGGSIYLYMGDGLIAIWDWTATETPAHVFRAVDAISDAIHREAAAYRERFGLVPEFRIGVHGGTVVVAEEGDTKRAIGVFGDPINVAARMEQTAKEHRVVCVVSAEVVGGYAESEPRFRALPPAQVKGIKEPVEIYEYVL
jgi:adenylate cyclase